MQRMLLQTAAAALVLAFLGGAPAEAAPGDIFTTPAKATIDIGVDGTVEDVALTGVPGEDATRIFSEQIRQWRFEPVLQDGQPVAARAYAEMNVFVVEDDAGALHLSVGRPAFRSPPGMAPEYLADADTGRSERIEIIRNRAPSYPTDHARRGVEAEIVLLVDIAPSGDVVRSGVSSAHFMNPPSDGVSDRAMARFVAASKSAVERWRFNPSDSESRRVLVPIRFAMRDTDTAAWQRLQPLREAREAWVAEIMQPETGPAKVADLESDTARFVLLNPPDLPWM